MAWVYMRRSHVNPHGLLQFFERLSKKRNVQADANDVAALLSTHPMPEDRKDALRKMDQESSAEVFQPIAMDFAKFKEDLARYETVHPHRLLNKN